MSLTTNTDDLRLLLDEVNALPNVGTSVGTCTVVIEDANGVITNMIYQPVLGTTEQIVSPVSGTYTMACGSMIYLSGSATGATTAGVEYVGQSLYLITAGAGGTATITMSA